MLRGMELNSSDPLIANVPEIEERLGYVFKNKELLILSFVHKSYYNEHRGEASGDNERLEFLGDSVLGLLVAEHLYATFPERAEGELSPLRSRLVEAAACAQYAQRLGLAPFVLLGKGERMQHEGRGRETILADLFEALIAAIYLDGGVESARAFFLFHFAETIAAVCKEPVRNWKAELQDYSQKRHQRAPVYHVMDESGPDHDKRFRIAVWVGDVSVGEGEGTSKKQAEQAAAQSALTALHG
jgi:ribonuclease-3